MCPCDYAKPCLSSSMTKEWCMVVLRLQVLQWAVMQKVDTMAGCLIRICCLVFGSLTLCELSAENIAHASGNVALAARPNIVWIVSEDNSKHFLQLFDAAGAATPNIDALAASGLTFDHAFSNSPVCSVARTTLATGVYAPRLGTQYHRKTKPVHLPAGWRMFSGYLRDAGYFTTNNSKTDYNAIADAWTWDESSNKATWRNRPEQQQPFFHMQSHTASHESSLHFTEQQMRSEKTLTDAAAVELAPYHPDTPLFRYTYARYHDRIQQIDRIVGETIQRLEQDGLLEDTFVFYFGDHGGVLPRGKGYVYESGLHVPLVVRIPEKWQHLIHAPRGSRLTGFVEFVDFGPTVLNLAGIPVPAHMDGRPFLGPGVSSDQLNAQNETFGYADRFDEKYEMIRTLRQGHWKYHRNYQAHYPDGLQNNYRYQMLAYEQWRRLFQQGKLNELQRAFFEPKMAEALYDLQADPHETRNLATDPAHRETLRRLRERLSLRVKAMPDLSFLPEPFLIAEGLNDPLAFGQVHQQRIAELVDVADLALLPFEQAESELEAAMGSDDPFQRQWAFTVCAVFGEKARPLASRAMTGLQDKDPLTRLRAAEFLGTIRGADPDPVILDLLRTSEDELVAAIVLNTAVYLRDTLGYQVAIQPEDVRASGDSVTRRLKYLSEQ